MTNSKVSMYKEHAFRLVIGLILSLLVLSITEFGIKGSIFTAVIVITNFMLSRSLARFLISLYVALSIFAITVAASMAISNKTIPSILALCFFLMIFLVASLYLGAQDWKYQTTSVRDSALVLIPVFPIVTWYNLLTNIGKSSAADRLTWFVSHGEDNASWIGAINSLSPAHEGGLFHGLTGGGGPALMPIVSILDGLASMSGNRYYSDLSTLTLMNVYGLTLLIALLTASVLSLSVVKLRQMGYDSTLTIASGFVVSLFTYLFYSTISLQGHLSAALAVSAFMGASLICLNVDLNLITGWQRIGLAAPIVLLIPGFWYPMAPFALFFFSLIFFDEFRKKQLSKTSKTSLALIGTVFFISLPLIRNTFFSTGEINPLDFLAFAGGVIQLSSLSYIILIVLMLVNLNFGLVVSRKNSSMMLVNLLTSLGLYLSIMWIVTYLLPKSGGPMYGVFKLSIVAFAAVLPMAIALVIHKSRLEFRDTRIFITVVSLVAVLVGAGIPEIANYRAPSRFADVRWAEPVTKIAQQNPNSQILCLSALDPLESHLCTRFAVALTASQDELSTNWLSAVRDRIPKDSWNDSLIVPFNNRASSPNSSILVIYLDSVEEVDAKYPWAVELLSGSKVQANQMNN